MQKVDLVIVALGVVALAVTAIGVATYEDGDSNYVFVESQVDYDGGSFTATMDTPVTALVSTPANATSAHATVTLGYTGQVFSGGSATATITITGPDGTSETLTEAFTVPQGGNGGELGTLEIHSTMWGEVPAGFSGMPEDRADYALNWDDDLEIILVVEAPAGPLANLENLSYTAEVTGWFATYHAVVDLPDVETA